jgi:uncharacterized protein YdeI (YjbR/CyaY-like superfamily)
MQPLFFTTPKAFRKWLEKNHDKKTEVLVGYYKLNSGKKSITWVESVDQALCFGWIDSVRRSIDEMSYYNRFTPRKSTSIWSAINIKKVEALREKGLMAPAGEKAFSLKKESKTNLYSHENPLTLDPKFEKQFKKDKKAWKFFSTQAPSYKKVTIHWIMSAKQDKTRISRLEKAIKLSGEEKKLL